MISFSGRIWVGSIALSGILLAASLPGAHAVVLASDSSLSLKSQLPVKVTKDLYGKEVRAKLETAEKAELKVAQLQVQVPEHIKDQAVAKPVESSKIQVAKAEPKPKPKPAPSNPPNQQISRGSSDMSSLVSNALSLRGVPYVFGGTSRNGFDCSGFTQYVFKASGISLPRTSYTQFGVGTAVNRQQLQAGDLVFFTTYAKGASHVGIYIGDGRFVHAADSGVKVTSLSDSYYASRYLGARRVQ